MERKKQTVSNGSHLDKVTGVLQVLSTPTDSSVTSAQPNQVNPKTDRNLADVADVTTDDDVAVSKKYNFPEGMTKTQKKNMRKAIRNKEKKEKERQIEQLPTDPIEQERIVVYENIKTEFDGLPHLANMSLIDVSANFRSQQNQMDRLLAEIDDAKEKFCDKIDKSVNRRMTSAQLLQQIRDIASMEKRDDSALEMLIARLKVLVSWENARKFKVKLTELRSKIEQRRKTNLLHAEKAKQKEKLMQLVDRIKSSKPLGDADKITVSSLYNQEIELSGEALMVMCPPVNVFRRMERIYGVAIERTNNSSKTFTITGLESDVKEVLKFLSEADFIGGTHITLDSRLMSIFVGRSGAGVRLMEEKTRCFFQTKNNTILIYGTKEKAQEALEQIKAIQSQKPPTESMRTTKDLPIDHVAIGRSLISRFLKNIREIESATGVNVRINTVSNEKFGEDMTNDNVKTITPLGKATVTFRGQDQSNITEATTRLFTFISELRVSEIPAPSQESLNKLFSRMRNPNNSAKMLSPIFSRTPQGAPERFNILQQTYDDVAFIKHEGSLALVGRPNAIEKVYEEAKDLLLMASYTKLKISLNNDEVFVFKPEKLDAIKEETGASLRKVRTPENLTCLEVLGSEEQKNNAEKLIKNIIASEAKIDELVLNSFETFAVLSKDGRRKLKEIERDSGSRIIMDRAASICRLIGSAESNATAIKDLIEVDESCADTSNLLSREVKLPNSDIIGRIIGQKGSTIQNIQESSEAYSIDVDSSNLIVRIRGTSDACDAAERMVKDIIGKNAPASVPQQQQQKQQEPKPRKSKATVVHAYQTTPGLKWGEDVEKENETTVTRSLRTNAGGWNQPSQMLDKRLDEEEDKNSPFPSLSEAIREFHKPKRSSKKGSVYKSLNSVEIQE